MNLITIYIFCSIVNVFSTGLLTNVNNDPYVTLEHTLNEIFFVLNYKCCLLTSRYEHCCNPNAYPYVFKIFYSHSQNLFGMPYASGYSALISVEGVQNLADYFHLTSSCAQSFAQPFELKGVKCNKRTD